MMLDRAAACFPPSKPNILITGFWRSGTTWLQEVLAKALHAKTVFESMSPWASGPLGAPWLKRCPLPLREAWMPLRYAALSAEDRKLLSLIFAGCAPDRYSLQCRRSVLESFRRRSVIKLVRTNFLLPDLIERYNLYVIHIRRHPGAVIASLLECGWAWSFKDVRFEQLFPCPEAVPSLREDIERLQRYDDRPDFERIAAYWAFSEKSIAAFRHARFMIAGYEPLLLSGRAGFAGLIDFVGGPSSARIEVDHDSVVTTAKRLNASADERAHSWTTKFDRGMLNRIDAAIAHIWPSAPVRDGALTHEVVTTRPMVRQADAQYLLPDFPGVAPLTGT